MRTYSIMEKYTERLDNLTFSYRKEILANIIYTKFLRSLNKCLTTETATLTDKLK